jgi:hypothetical protein
MTAKHPGLPLEEQQRTTSDIGPSDAAPFSSRL